MNVLDALSVTLTQGHGCHTDYNKFVCLYDRIWTTLPITIQFSSIICMVMIIIWLHLEGWLSWLTWNKKEIHWLDTGSVLWPWSWPQPWPWQWTLQGQILKSLYLKYFDVKWKGIRSIGYWANFVKFTFDPTNVLGIEFKVKVKVWNSLIPWIHQ